MTTADRIAAARERVASAHAPSLEGLELRARAFAIRKGHTLEELEERRDASLEREGRREASYGMAKRAPCGCCGRFKPRPSSRCDYCGDEPVSHNGSSHDFDMAYGYGAA